MLKLFENRVLKKIFGPKMNEITEEWRRLLNEELYDMFSTPDVTWVTRLRRMRWVGHVACIAERKIYIGFWWKNLRERAHLEVLGEEGRIILK
jgi:hypothetical protein